MARVASIAFTHYDSDPRVRRMAEALAERGDDVTAIVLRQKGTPRRRVVDGVDVFGVPLPRYRGASNLAYAVRYAAFFAAATAAVSTLHIRRPFDVIHVNNMPDAMVFTALPAKLMGAKVILDLHDPMPELYASKFIKGENHRAVRVITAAERASVSFADRVITVNEVMRDTFVRHGNPSEAFTIIQNVADPRYFPVGAALESGARGEVPTVVYHGTLARRLGLDVAIQAMRHITDLGKTMALVIIGDGDDAPRLTELVDELDLGDVVDLRLGFEPVERLLPQLIDADIGIVPAQSGPFTDNMVPSKLLEYVALGIPVVCSDLPAVRHYFSADEVSLVPPGDPEALARAITTLADDPNLRADQARRAMRFVEQHGWEAERQRYFDLIDAVVGS
jgi:glycosyltransferase involved in cell wall biosynthesis